MHYEIIEVLNGVMLIVVARKMMMIKIWPLASFKNICFIILKKIIYYHPQLLKFDAYFVKSTALAVFARRNVNVTVSPFVALKLLFNDNEKNVSNFY